MIGKIAPVIIGVSTVGAVAVPMVVSQAVDNNEVDYKLKLEHGGFQERIDMIGQEHNINKSLYIWGQTKEEVKQHVDEFIDSDQQRWIEKLRSYTKMTEMANWLADSIEKDHNVRYRVSRDESYELTDYHYVIEPTFVMNTANKDFKGEYKFDENVMKQELARLQKEKLETYTEKLDRFLSTPLDIYGGEQ